MRSRRVISLVGILASVAILATACGDADKLDSTDSDAQSTTKKGAVVVGSGGFTEHPSSWPR